MLYYRGIYISLQPVNQILIGLTQCKSSSRGYRDSPMTLYLSLVFYNPVQHIVSDIAGCLQFLSVRIGIILGPYGPLTRYVKLWVTHAPGMPGTFAPLPRISDPDMHHGTCVTHVPWCMPGSLTRGFLWNRWRGKRSRHSRRMRNPQF